MLVTPWSVTAAVGAGWVVHLLWQPRLLARVTARSHRAPLRLPVPLRPRPDALAGRTRAIVGAGVGVGILLWSDSLPWFLRLTSALVAAVAVGIGLGLLEPSTSAARRQRLVADLPQSLRLAAAALGAGLPLRGAMRAVAASVGGPVSEELRGVLAQIEIGVAEEDAWLSLRDHPVLGALARDLARAVASGTAVQSVLLHRAAEIQSDHRATVESRAKAVGVRTVLPLGLCFLPAFMLLGVVPVVAGLLLPLFQP